MPEETPDSPTIDESASDALLIARSIQRDERAWRVLVGRYKRLVYSIPNRYRFHEETCDDVFQSVFSQLWRDLSKLRDSATLAKWLLTTTHRECWRVSRKDARHPTVDDSVIDLQPDASPQDTQAWERQHLVHKALRELGGPCEALLRAIFIERSQPSYGDISQRLGMPVGSIGPARARCLAKLAKRMPELL